MESDTEREILEIDKETAKSTEEKNLKSASQEDLLTWRPLDTIISSTVRNLKSKHSQETFTPKIQIAYEVGFKLLLRNAEIERLRQLYRSFNLEDLLLERDISGSDLTRSHYLPLEIFDDNEYDCRTPKEWMNLGLIDGKQHPVPAQALLEVTSKPIEYHPVAVVDYDQDTKLWQFFTLDGERRIFHLPRLYVRFYAEDPRAFVDRIAAAIHERNRAEASMRYNLYVDCIPTEGMNSLSDLQKEEIIRLTVATGNQQSYKENRITSVFREIERNYQRVMCDLECQYLLRNHYAVCDFFSKYCVPPDSNSTFSTPRSNSFQSIKELVEWNTIYVQTQIYETMRNIVNECNKVSKMVLFTFKFGKSMSFDELEVLQKQTIHTVINYLKSSWLEYISQTVILNLRDIGKGWFDFKQKNHNIYEVMKLKRLLELIKQHMQAALRTLLENSSLLFLTIFETPIISILNVESDFVWDSDLTSKQFQCMNLPIFEIEIYMNQDGPFYTTDLHLFEEKLDSLYVYVFQLCQKIGQIQPMILKNLKFSRDLYINSVDIQEPLMRDVRKRIRRAYNKSMIPLVAYLKRIEQYRSLFDFNIHEYVENFKNIEYTIVGLKEEILSHYSLKAKLEDELPYEIFIGAFKVNMEKLKKFLINKRQEIINHLLEMHTNRLHVEIDDMLNDFKFIYRKLSVEPANIEEVFELRDWMEGVPITVSNHFENYQKLKIEYDVLESLRWSLSDEDFESRYEAMHFPLRIKRKIDQLNRSLVHLEKDTFWQLQLNNEEEINYKIDAIIGNVTSIAVQTDIKKINEISSEIINTWKVMKELQEFGILLNSRQKLFGKPIVPFDKLTSLIKDFEPYKNFWLTANDWLKWHEIWMNDPLISIIGTGIDTMVNDMYKMMGRCVKMFQDQPAIADLAVNLKTEMEYFKPYIYVIQSLRNAGMKTRHMKDLTDKTGINMTLTSDLTFKKLLSSNVMDFQEIIQDTSETAAKEYGIEQSLQKMKADWESLEMNVEPHKDTGTYIVKIADEVQLLLDDHIINTQQLSFSPFKEAFSDDIDDWALKLKLTQEVILLWTEVQKLWMYLEPIFTSEDISRQLPVESKKYNTLDRNWRRIMKVAFDNPFIIKVCPDKTLLESLRECISLLEIVQKGLSDYLESRRMLFPRFFFLSDDELLEILAQTKNVQAVQPHLKKCFENMKELRFEADLTITRMYSAENEEVILNPPVKPEGSVEYWLNTVESSMKSTIRLKVRQALKKVELLPRKDWVYKWPGQVSLCGGQTSWTAHVEKAIKTRTLKNYLKVMMSQLDDLRTLVRGQQTEIQRLMVEAIITIEVHARDVLLKLIEESVSNANDFDWISQLRYYWINDSELKVRAVNAEFQYGYEYLGNNGRLVITPLTDRCYLTLTGALHLKFGGAPAGPAGTGKTETTKDLAKAFAIQCVVFNCSDQLDFMSMGKFFKGLASSGAWACFDEFNRIDVEVLSVIAQQLMTIQKAQQLQAEKFIFEGVELRLRHTCAAFITMNPGYAGRTELPDNLKALFRPVAMMVPNYTLIAEISLFSCGFAEAKTLAAKITATFKLSSEQLSSQDHYDFGMRSVKTVIAVAGILKREQKDMEESQICLRALRDVNVPKFLKDDLKLFNGIVSDLFPKIVEKTIDYDMFIGGIKETIKEMGLAAVKDFIHKVIQLYETTIVRHGLMLVGPTGSGKTKCYQVLKSTCTKLKGQLQPSGKPFSPVHTYVLNPKSITMGQLYGEYDLSTHEWTDGILSSLIRTGTTATDEDKRWYVFDGPVDAVWIENMNTVLDDNKKLCLSSGEIMRLLPTQTMIFEVADLKVASPATVSRCGMVYMEPKGLGINPFIDCWIDKFPESMKRYTPELSKLAYLLLLPALKFLRENLNEIVTTVDSGLVQAYINLMDYQIGTVKNPEKNGIPVYLLEPWSVFALIWSVGATCDWNSRYLFSEWLRDLQNKAEHQMQFPPDGLVYDYKLGIIEVTENAEESEQNQMQWVKWLENAPSEIVNIERKFSDIEIVTVDMMRSSALIDYLLMTECNVLCVGPTGSGKTLTISTKLSREMPKRFVCDFINFSARTSANQTQDLIDSKLDKRRRGVYGPPISKKQIFFIDDLNMPALETYGAQPPIELLRQFMDFKGWYDRKEIGSFRAIEDVNFICAMAPPGGGRNPITARLLRHFHFIAFPEMEDETKRNIFGTILFSWLINTQTLEEFSEPLVTVTMNVYSIICKKLLPTPDKSHYTFNLRDLGKVFQGVLMADPKSISIPDDLLLLWYHENFRVFSDRLTNDTDRIWFKNLLRENLMDQFNYNMNESLSADNLFYGDFCSSRSQYEHIHNKKKMEKTLLDFLEDYNSSSTMPMNIVLFQDAMSHICRITRILRQSPGNALLLGMGGSGRQSLTKLSSHIAEYFCFQIELTKTYSTRDWTDDVKSILLKTGLHNKHTVFLFSDTQIKSDLFLEDINNILSSGDVGNVYQPDEMDNIFQAMRPFVQASGLQINKSNLLAVYRKIIRNNLHSVISMCPIGELFRARIRQFPALVNLCTIDWFDPWPDSALKNVAMHFLGNVRDEAITDSVLKSIVKTCQFMHSSVIKASEDFAQELNRHNYVTPTSYLELISNYGDLLTKKRNELTLGISRLTTGLERLAATEIEVKDLQIVLEQMKPKLEKAAQSAAKMMEHISRDTNEAEIARMKAAEQENEASKLKKENQAIKDEAEADLSTARPLLEAAEASLKALNKGDITEVKAMKRPPVGVILVIETICIIKKVKPNKIPGERPGEKLNDYWTPGSQMLADAGQFLASLEKYNKDELTEEMINKLRIYIENPNFQPQKVMQISKACHSLCLWVHALYNYYFVNLRVAPKMAALVQAEKDLAKTEAILAKAMAKLKKIQDGLDLLQFKFQTEEKKKADLEKQKQLCEERMVRAVRLITGLAGEQVRWLETVAEIKKALTNIVGDILLSVGAIAYLTPFIDTYRKRLLTSWYQVLGEGVPHTPGCSPISVLGDPVEIRKWQIDGLPRDSLSVENAVLVTNSKRWPLFIDPQGQANRWIRNVGKVGGVSTVRMTDKDLLRVVESCIRFGRTCLIENVGLELEAALDTVLMRSLFRQAGVMSIKIGDNIVPYNYDFRLYLTTKLPNPHYTPEVAVKVLLVNFTLTASGLADQMLSLVVMQERPELEETRSALIVSSAQMKHELKEIEDRILYRLSLSEGSPVDDIDLILTLEASKVKSTEIKIKVEAVEATQIDIDAARSLYIPVANRAQILFFCLLDLQLIDPMYQYSLEWFIRIFTNSMLNTEKNDDVNIRVYVINEHLTFSLYTNVCRSLFEKHKLHFAFLLCIRIQMMENLIDHGEWRFLLSGAIPPKEKPNPATSWLSQRSWIEIQSLEVLPAFQDFVSAFESQIPQFKTIFDSHQPEVKPYPEPWNSTLNDFQKMLVIKCLRPDKVTNVMQSYITKFLGGRFIEPHSAGLDAIFDESSPTTPLIFILSTGTDPASELYKFADKLKMTRKLFSISLGQGQGPKAELMLKQSLAVGNWLFFQNCHLAPSWMPKLEILVETLPPDVIHRDFRLWLTSMPSPAFPVSILQNGSKMTIEPPRGVKANVLRTYSTRVIEMEDFFESENEKVPVFKSLIFSLCLFHAVLVERRKFGPLGFNIPYEFTDGDFTICMSQLHMFLLEYVQVPFKVLIYTAGHINYGGRITDDWDRRCVLTILENFYNEDVLVTDHQFDSYGNYRQPSTETTLAEYFEVIKQFPINDDPVLFGLHNNADISYAQAETYACLSTLLTLQPRDIGSSVSKVEEVTNQLARNILNDLPEPFDLNAIQMKYPIAYEESLNTVLLQEAARYNVLIIEMSSSLKDLLNALKGLVVMSDKLEAMSSSMYSNKVPENWTNKSFASLKPLGSWVEDLKERIDFITQWQDNGIPAAFWISGFYFPQAFLTGTLQNYARKYSISIDLLEFSFKVLPDKPQHRPTNGCAVYGLFLEGCRWDGTSLAESFPKELYTKMPPIQLTPEVNYKKAETGTYECPVYKTVQRAGTLSTTGHSTNFILSMEIPTREPQEHWIVRGVALICALDF